MLFPSNFGTLVLLLPGVCVCVCVCVTKTKALDAVRSIQVWNQVMHWETATPLGFPVCMRHKGCGLTKDSGGQMVLCFYLQLSPVGKREVRSGVQFPWLIPTTCQIRYHSHFWDHRRTGQL